MELPYDLDFLRSLILTALSSGVAGYLVVRVMNAWKPLAAIESALLKRMVAWGLSALFAGGLWGFAVLMLYLPQPTDWRQAVEIVVSLGSIAYGVSQAIHGKAKDARDALKIAENTSFLSDRGRAYRLDPEDIEVIDGSVYELDEVLDVDEDEE